MGKYDPYCRNTLTFTRVLTVSLSLSLSLSLILSFSHSTFLSSRSHTTRERAAVSKWRMWQRAGRERVKRRKEKRGESRHEREERIASTTTPVRSMKGDRWQLLANTRDSRGRDAGDVSRSRKQMLTVDSSSSDCLLIRVSALIMYTIAIHMIHSLSRGLIQHSAPATIATTEGHTSD